MRGLIGWQLPALLFAAVAAAAQDQAPTPPDQTKQQVTITAPREQPLPQLPPDAFRKCMGAVDLDPSLAGYVKIKDRTASLALPPL